MPYLSCCCCRAQLLNEQAFASLDCTWFKHTQLPTAIPLRTPSHTRGPVSAIRGLLALHLEANVFVLGACNGTVLLCHFASALQCGPGLSDQESDYNSSFFSSSFLSPFLSSPSFGASSFFSSSFSSSFFSSSFFSSSGNLTPASLVRYFLKSSSARPPV